MPPPPGSSSQPPPPGSSSQPPPAASQPPPTASAPPSRPPTATSRPPPTPIPTSSPSGDDDDDDDDDKLDDDEIGYLLGNGGRRPTAADGPASSTGSGGGGGVSTGLLIVLIIVPLLLVLVLAAVLLLATSRKNNRRSQGGGVRVAPDTDNNSRNPDGKEGFDVEAASDASGGSNTLLQSRPGGNGVFSSSSSKGAPLTRVGWSHIGSPTGFGAAAAGGGGGVGGPPKLGSSIRSAGAHAGSPRTPASLAGGAAASASAAILPAGSRRSNSSEVAASMVSAFELDPEDLNLERELGRGSFATVYAGEYHSSPVAVKLLVGSTERESTALENEVKIMCNVRSPHTVLYIGHFATVTGQFGIVMQLLDESLEARIAREGALPERQTVELALPIAQACAYLHNRGIVHRDLKAGNVLLDAFMKPYVSDFGLSRVLSSVAATHTSSGTVNHCAPELIEGKRYDNSVDVFSFAVLLAHCLTGEVPYMSPGTNPMFVAAQIVDGKRPPLPEGTSPALRSLINDCWNAEPTLRPSFVGIVGRLQAIQNGMGPAED